MDRTRSFRIALLQLNVTKDKKVNIDNAVNHIRTAVKDGKADVVVLPECFTCPYGEQYFGCFAEEIPNGETSRILSETARELEIYLIGGSFPEVENDILYNSCPIWGPDGGLIAVHRKLHLLDIDVPGWVTFNESDIFDQGNALTFVNINEFKIGIFFATSLRFPELSMAYRNQNCDMFICPGTIETYLGPLHWDLLARSRANDNQVFVASVSSARDDFQDYVSYGHSMVVDPWGKVLQRGGNAQEIVIADIDFSIVNDIRSKIPLFRQRRTDLFDPIPTFSRTVPTPAHKFIFHHGIYQPEPAVCPETN